MRIPKLAWYAAGRRSADQRLQAQNKSLEGVQEPLRKLIYFSQLLRQDAGEDLSPAAGEDLQHITEAAQRLQRLVQDLLALSRAGQSAMTWEEVALDDDRHCPQGALAADVGLSSASAAGRDSQPRKEDSHSDAHSAI